MIALEFRKAEVTQLWDIAIDQTEEDEINLRLIRVIVAIGIDRRPFAGIPRPLKVWIKELDDGDTFIQTFVRIGVKRRQFGQNRLCSQLHMIHLLSKCFMQTA